MAKEGDWHVTDDGRIYRRSCKKYPNGDMYTGDFIDGLREGQGTLEYINGSRYEGQFKANHFDGEGCMKYGPLFEDGEEIRGRVYEGEWANGLKCGKGVQHTGTGQVYEGWFQNDMYHGPGVLRGPDRISLEGEWRRGKLNGESRCTYAEGLRYTGGMLDGEFHGKGRLVFGKRGGYYEGEFRLGKQDGVGTRKYMNGNLYEGSFKDGKAHGGGTMRFASGDVYVGEWHDGQREGKGVLTLASGDRYEGDFLKGHIYGRGRYVWSDGGRYEGDFMATSKGKGHDVSFPNPNGLRHGVGRRVWSNGAAYEGRWEDGRMKGNGVYTCPEGSRYDGDFHANYRHGWGICRWGNRHETPFRCPMGYLHPGRGHCVYEGEWKFGSWHGQGKFLCMDDRMAEGTWNKGKLDGWGSSILMLSTERGDPRRMFIGGVGGLYRVFKYSGQWRAGVRQGFGVAEYANHDKVIGNFIGTFLNGYGIYLFGASGNSRAGVWKMGTRLRWTNWEEAESQSNIIALIHEALLRSPEPLLAGDVAELQKLWCASCDKSQVAGSLGNVGMGNTCAELFLVGIKERTTAVGCSKSDIPQSRKSHRSQKAEQEQEQGQEQEQDKHRVKERGAGAEERQEEEDRGGQKDATTQVQISGIGNVDGGVD